MPADPEVDALVKEGASLSEAEAEALELGLEQRPGDLDARARLLGYCAEMRRKEVASASFADRLANSGGRSPWDVARARHAVWVAANAPAAPLAGHPLVRLQFAEPAYPEASACWRRHLEADPPDATVLAHAIAFFRHENDMFAEELLGRAERAYPGDPRWAAHRREMDADELILASNIGVVAAFGEESAPLREIERQLGEPRLDAPRKALLRIEAARVAFRLGDIPSARYHAEAMLVTVAEPGQGGDRPDGDLAHHGHIILGRIALRSGDVERAKAHLALAGKVRGPGLLQVSGPRMSLASELLARGERHAVLSFLALCRGLSESNDPKLDHWAAQIRAGEVPDFGSDLD